MVHQSVFSMPETSTAPRFCVCSFLVSWTGRDPRKGLSWFIDVSIVLHDVFLSVYPSLLLPSIHHFVSATFQVLPPFIYNSVIFIPVVIVLMVLVASFAVVSPSVVRAILVLRRKIFGDIVQL